MFFKSLAVAVFAVYLAQDVLCQSPRQSIISQYQPILSNLKLINDLKYTESSQEYNTLVNQIKANDNQTRSVLNGQIANIRSLIALAKQHAQNKTQVLSCVRQQETIAGRLTTTQVQTCTNIANANISIVNNIRAQYPKLAALAYNTITYCQNLNPLGSQDGPFEQCLNDKVVDLNRQVILVEKSYNSASNDTLNVNVKCLMQNSATTLNQIGSISYELNLCAFRV